MPLAEQRAVSHAGKPTRGEGARAAETVISFGAASLATVALTVRHRKCLRQWDHGRLRERSLARRA
jgi:hypothetical protein